MESWDIIGPAVGALVAGPIAALVKAKIITAYRLALDAAETRDRETQSENTQLLDELSATRAALAATMRRNRELEDRCNTCLDGGARP